MRQSHLRFVLLVTLALGLIARAAGAIDAGASPPVPADAPKGAGGADGANAPGGGAEFTVTLPRRPAPEASPSAFPPECSRM